MPDVQSTHTTINTVEALDERISQPTPAVVEMFARLSGDVVVLGVAGKMGPTLARMASRASDEAGSPRRVIGVSRFSNPAERDKLDAWGIETVAGDLLDDAFVRTLPAAPNVVFMAGMKFGSTGKESLTWAMNTLLPAAVCRHYADSCIAAFSTGNVYDPSPLHGGGSVETDAPSPRGEYAMSCLGRERTFEHFSRTQGTKVALLRLNYAAELRYGVLVDLAQKVWQDQPIDLATGMANVIWQGDANAHALLSLEQAASPPCVLNIAGPEQLSVRRLCERLGEHLGKQPTFVGEPSDSAILSNAGKAHRLFGYPAMPIDELIEHVANWTRTGGELLGKATKFEVRDGKF
ncbi:MAG: NAD-dependent epimerase/dehydratase family protein [Phycisphaeraceae bacterium]